MSTSRWAVQIAECGAQFQAHPRARQPHRRPRRDQRGAPGGERGRV